ncbi:MAG: hypothetical protein JWO67_5628 [Streptosporangiaceae bacterium]|nr:hypothetical protein [Streptosporangiaceae bacterium]
MTSQHFLLVHEDPADGMEIEHLDTCPRTVTAEMAVYECAHEAMAQEYGLDAFFGRDAEPHPLHGVRQVVAPGRHPVEYWCEEIKLAPFIGVAEYDHGLTIAGGAT